DQLTHPGRGMRPGHAEALLDVGPDLRAEAEDHPALRVLVQVVADVGEGHRVAGEGHRDPGHELHPLGVLGGEGQRQEGVVLGLDRDEPVVALGLQRPGPLRRAAQVRAEVGVDLHPAHSSTRPPRPEDGTSPGSAASRGGAPPRLRFTPPRKGETGSPDRAMVAGGGGLPDFTRGWPAPGGMDGATMRREVGRWRVTRGPCMATEGVIDRPLNPPLTDELGEIVVRGLRPGRKGLEALGEMVLLGGAVFKSLRTGIVWDEFIHQCDIFFKRMIVPVLLIGLGWGTMVSLEAGNLLQLAQASWRLGGFEAMSHIREFDAFVMGDIAMGVAGTAIVADM